MTRPAAWRELLVALIAAAIAFINLGVPSLMDVDEPRNAVCAREMMERGDWIVPTFNGELRTHKPVLLYWLIGSAYHLFGVNEFAARFWSAVAAVGTSLLTCYLGRRLFSPQVGLWAGLVLATSLNFGVIARVATPDSIFLFCITLAVALFVRASWQPVRSPEDRPRLARPRCWDWIAIYAAVGMAMLAKGPLGFVLPVGLIGLTMLSHANSTARTSSLVTPGSTRRCLARFLFKPTARLVDAAWSMRPLTMLAVLSIVVLPWCLAVDFKTEGRWMKDFLLTHNLDRFRETRESHSGPFYYYPLVILVGFFPWSLFAIPTIEQLIRRVRLKHACMPGYVLAASWVALYTGLLTLSATKLPNYILPAYPALALLTAGFLESVFSGRSDRAVRWLPISSVCLTLAGIAMAVALPLVAQRHLPGDEIIGMAGAVPLLGGVLCLILLQRSLAPRALQAFALSAIALALVAFGFVAVRLDRHHHTEPLVNWIREQSAGRPIIAGYENFKPSWVYYTGGQMQAHWSPEQAHEFFSNTEHAYLITNHQAAETLTGKLPPGVVPLARSPQLFGKEQIVVWGRTAATQASAAAAADLITAADFGF